MLDPLQLVFLPGNSDQQIQRDQKEYDHYNVCVEQGIACASFIEQKKLSLIDEHDDDLADVDQESDPHEEQAKVFREILLRSRFEGLRNNTMDSAMAAGSKCPAQARTHRRSLGWLAENREADSTR